MNALRERRIFAAGTAFWQPPSRNWGIQKRRGQRQLEILRIEPKYTISITRALALVKHREHYLDGLRMAGLPE